MKKFLRSFWAATLNFCSHKISWECDEWFFLNIGRRKDHFFPKPPLWVVAKVTIFPKKIFFSFLKVYLSFHLKITLKTYFFWKKYVWGGFPLNMDFIMYIKGTWRKTKIKKFNTQKTAFFSAHQWKLKSLLRYE